MYFVRFSLPFSFPLLREVLSRLLLNKFPIISSVSASGFRLYGGHFFFRKTFPLPLPIAPSFPARLFRLFRRNRFFSGFPAFLAFPAFSAFPAYSLPDFFSGFFLHFHWFIRMNFHVAFPLFHFQSCLSYLPHAETVRALHGSPP